MRVIVTYCDWETQTYDCHSCRRATGDITMELRNEKGQIIRLITMANVLTIEIDTL